MIDCAEMCSCLEEVFMRRITWRLSFFIIIAAECFHPRWHTNSLVWHSCQQHNIRNWTVGLHTFTSGSKMIASSQSWSYLGKNRMSSFWWLCKLAYCCFNCHIRQCLKCNFWNSQFSRNIPPIHIPRNQKPGTIVRVRHKSFAVHS